MKELTKADREFLASFEARTMSGSEFHHREHLRLAYIYLSLHPPALALEKMETGLRNLLAHLGAPASKYHHTLTEAWLRAVQHFMDRAGPTVDFAQFLETASPLLDKEIMGTHYSTDLLWSEAARASFVEPDLQPIPLAVNAGAAELPIAEDNRAREPDPRARAVCERRDRLRRNRGGEGRLHHHTRAVAGYSRHSVPRRFRSPTISSFVR